MDPILQARVDLAAALRWAERLGLNEGIDNHFSYAVSDDGRCFLVNPLGFHWRELRATDLVPADPGPKILEGKNAGEGTALFIPSPVHVEHPTPPAALHTPTP